MQEMLLGLGYDLGSYGCDGDFGDMTDMAVRAFQDDSGLAVDGEAGPLTLNALQNAIEKNTAGSNRSNVLIVGGNCYIRTAPNTDGKILGVAMNGDMLKYLGETSETGWLLVSYKEQRAWVSGKYGKLD